MKNGLVLGSVIKTDYFSFTSLRLAEDPCIFVEMLSLLRLFGLIFWSIAVLSSCRTTDITSDPAHIEALRDRAEKIKSEPAGDYFVGRRYYVYRMRFWGYLREPGQEWKDSSLVVMNERIRPVPDRVPEIREGEEEVFGLDPSKLKGLKRFGFDHNYEYKIKGKFSGKKVYDPNSNMFIPEFILTDCQLINADPGWLISPLEIYNFKVLPKFRGM